MPKPSPKLQHLIEMKLQRERERTPLYPDKYRVPPKYEVTTANGLTKAIIDLIDLVGGWATRISTEGRTITTKRVTHGVFGATSAMEAKRIPSSTKLGTADIHAVVSGRHLSIEVKVGRDRQSERQLEVEQRIRQAGGIYIIASDFDSVYDQVMALTQQRSA